MSRVLCAAMILVLAGCSVICAQDAAKSKKTPSLDIFGGFSYANYELISITSSSSAALIGTVNVSPLPVQTESARLGLYGWNGAISANMDSWFSFVTDFSGIYSNGSTSIVQTFTISNCPASGSTCTETIQNTVKSPRIHNFLFGPQFEYPRGKVRPFARFLVGGSRRSISTSEIITENGSPVTTFAALASSLPANNQFAMAFGGGADYRLNSKLAWRTTVDYLTGQGTGQDNVRVSSGILWRSGR